ncbi:unnamed protein product [Rhizoctonia solani]|uniref:Uncharacterized protein n=1 Tax=Rhizoctonia solani TaxID=456999 RepID=A0A8H3DAT4_9AGAM|nr:unnamed protein product [Rhizoctonia solani]
MSSFKLLRASSDSHPHPSITTLPHIDMPRDSTYVPSDSTGPVRNELDSWSEASSVDTIVRFGSFECRGDGLLVDGFPCETPTKLKRLLKPDENSGRMPIPNRERRKKWWRAQCIHYGIRVPANATIDTYRAYLGNAIPHQVELKRPRERIFLEERLNQAYHDAKARGESDIDMTPILTSKRHGSELRDATAERSKRVCPAARPMDAWTHTPIGLSVPRLNYLDVLRQHELNMFIGMYNLKLDKTSPIARAGRVHTLVIAAGFDQLRFEGFIKLPGIMSCALVFDLGSFSKQNEHQRITIQFKWRGKLADRRVLTPDLSQVGQLTLDLEHCQVKGSIDGPVQAGFEGTRANSAQRGLLHRWEDLDVASN